MRAFVLTGGASLGAVHVGMLQALYGKGITPDLIVGASVGAINGVFIASRPQTPETAQALTEVWTGLSRSDIFPTHFATGLLGFSGRRAHMIPNRGLRRLLKTHTQFANLEDARIPLHVVATDAANGQELVLTSGNAVEAVLASAAIPGIFPPVEWEGRTLIDGGISNYAPISHALEAGADTIYVLTSGTACAVTEPPRGALPMILQSMSFLVTRRLAIEMEHLRDRAVFMVLPPPCPLDVPPSDFSQAAKLIEASFETTSRYLDSVDVGASPPVPIHLMRLGSHAQH
jgi:NTE family protein